MNKVKSTMGASSTGARNQNQSTVNTAAGKKHPPCPPDKTGQCRKEPKGGHSHRKTAFRVPLKKEDGNMEAQIIEYNCEQPNRVAVRLEYLMQSTRVRLNDRHYMDDLYEKLLEEERRNLVKATKAREKSEENRMKRLIIEGMMKDIPPELNYLHRHPVFRVNQMFARLKEFDMALLTRVENEEITPVEPYEYNGNKFFQYLHDTGTVWVPSVQMLFEEEKLRGKVKRAKLRLMQKRKEEAAEAKIFRIMNNLPETDGKVEEAPPPQELYLDEEEEDEMEDAENELHQALKMETMTKPLSQREMLADTVQAKSRTEILRIEDRIKRSKENERRREAALDVKRQEHEVDFHDTIDHDKNRILSRFGERVKQRNVEEIFRRPNYGGPAHKIKGAGVDLKPCELLLAREDETEIEEAEEDPLFKKLRKVYDIPGYYPFHHYDAFENSFILDHLDPSEDRHQLLENGDEIADLYFRQQLTADDYLLNKLDLSAYTELAARRRPTDIDRPRNLKIQPQAGQANQPNQSDQQNQSAQPPEPTTPAVEESATDDGEVLVEDDDDIVDEDDE